MHRFHGAPPYVGLWVVGFETSNFYEGLTHPNQLLGRKSTVWFATDRETVMLKGFKPTFRSNVFRVTFVGRTAREMNRKMFEGYGHFSMYPGLVLADHILKFRDLGPDPR